MLYNMFLLNHLIIRCVGRFSYFFYLLATEKMLLIIWRRNNKKVTLKTIREKNQ
jgi:hypothetical protein